MVHVSLFPTALGNCGIVWDGETVIATSLPEASPEATEHRLVAQTGATKASPPEAIQRAIDGMTALLEGERPDLSAISCDFRNSDAFAQQVYALTRDVGPGETTTYGAIAKKLGDVQLARSVGQALGRNPIPIIVPCHRIVGADGKLVGFSADGGVSLKLRLLDIEKAQIGDAPSLFDELPLAIKPTH